MQVKILMPPSQQPISVIENFFATVTLSFCIIPDELILKQLEVKICFMNTCPYSVVEQNF